jgi:MFS family permease
VISTIGDFFVPVAISFAVLDLTGSVSDLGLVLFARILGQVLFFLAGGVWADRLPRQQVMVASHIVRFFSQGLLGVLLVSGNAQIWELIALQFVHGAATGVFRPAASGLTPQLVPAEQLQAANGLMYLTLSIGGIVGPAVGGLRHRRRRLGADRRRPTCRPSTPVSSRTSPSAPPRSKPPARARPRPRRARCTAPRGGRP